MRNHFVCGSFDPPTRGVSFKCGHQATLFGHSNNFPWHGHHGLRHGHGHHGHRHGPHRLHFHGPWGHGHGHHNHGSHSNRMHCHGPHGHASHDNGYPCYRTQGFGPHQGKKTCQPNHFLKFISYEKRLFGGPHQCQRGHHREGKQGCSRADQGNFSKIAPRPHSV